MHTSKLCISDSPRLNGIDRDHVRILAEVDDPLPAIIVHYPTMQVIDGMHRLEAALLKGLTEIDAHYFRGNEAEAFRLAVAANIKHGLPLTQAERQSAATRIIRSHPQLSDRSIAAITGLSAKTVARIRHVSHGGITDQRIGRDGKVRPLSTAEGRRIASRTIIDRPGASLREIAREAGVSVGTVRDVRARLASGQDPVPSRHRTPYEREPSRAAAGRPDAHHAVSTLDPGEMLDGLRRDPALRYSESGRHLLRWLGAHVVSITQARTTLGNVPPHCAVVVAKIARGYADVWRLLAIELERQDDDM
ncbi:ParB/RepB/Spo0J family partition protein [Nonomuraea diastatica]|uniref:ParB/RepB/Spo0J family partition protein n=1 Tax=Nonomuraea diastatica TaxID=1848329 RepID=UPI00140B51DC|nr:ParB/RepB/Spo0J family partition protein [Nonomuraea diastatica]